MGILTTAHNRIVCTLALLLLLPGISEARPALALSMPGAVFNDAPSLYATLDGSRVHYKSYGTGREALVFVHGWTCNMTFWRGQVPAFESRNRVIVIDLPGHGASDKPKIAYTMDLFARSIEAVMHEAGVDRAVLVGHSMGTPVIREFYRKYPAKTMALVIVDGPLRPFADAATIAKFLEPLRGPNYTEAAGGFVDNMLAPVSSPALRQEIKATMLSVPQYVAVSAMEGMMTALASREEKINVPVLAIMTKNWPPDNESGYRGMASNLNYQIWDGVSHFLMMEKVREFNDALAAFLTKNGLFKK